MVRDVGEGSRRVPKGQDQEVVLRDKKAGTQQPGFGILMIISLDLLMSSPLSLPDEKMDE